MGLNGCKPKSCHRCNNLRSQNKTVFCRKIKGLGWFEEHFKRDIFSRMEIAEPGNKLAALFREAAAVCQFYDNEL